MPGVHRFIGNNRNAIRNAVLSALSVRQSTAYRQSSATREGSGRVRMLGSYTGADDASYDVEIVSDTGSNPQVSSPVLSGAGNGTISGVSVDAGVSTQTFTIRLVDLGTDTETASVPFYGVTLQAAAAGSAGNNITLTVDESGLTYTATDYSLLDDLSAGSEAVTGSEWDFGAKSLDAGGGIPADAPRLVFGDDPQIYRQYKVEVAGEWSYRFAPAVVRAVPAGTAVKTVSGSRTVTVTDGSNPETYSSVVTLHDLLDGIRRKSVLLTVDGVVTADRAPGGMASRDLPLRTSAHALPVTASGSQYATELTGVTVAAGAPTEQVTIQCTAAPRIGAEEWSVVGSVAGTLASATTGQAYAAANWGFTVPAKSPDADAVADLDVRPIFVTRDVVETTPEVCVSNITLGAAASSKTLTFTYRQRPSPDCGCENASVSGRLSANCLGIEEQIDVSTLDPEYATRLQDLYKWRRDFIRANTDMAASPTGESTDITIVNQVVTLLSGALESFWSDATARANWDELFGRAKSDLQRLFPSGSQYISAWDANTEYPVGHIIIPTAGNDNGHMYLCTTSGTVGSTEPTWQTDGTAVTDGTTEWQDLGVRTALLYDQLPAWQASTDYAVGEMIYLPSATGSFEYFVYECTKSGTSGTTEPSPVNVGGTRTDGTAEWTSLGVVTTTGATLEYTLWSAAMEYTIGELVIDPATARIYRVVDAGESGATVPTWSNNGLTTDNTVKWVLHGFDRYVQSSANGSLHVDATSSSDDFLARYASEIDHIGISVGIVPGKSNGSSTSTGCWTDPGTTYWWEPDGEYLPAFTNRVWHSAKRQTDGSISSTQEFALTIRCACPSDLKDGDQVTVAINNVSGDAQAYRVGDKFILPIVSASALSLDGGADGDDTLAWQVYGSADGLLSEYTMTDGAGSDYATSGLHFAITSGGVPFAVGDQFSFAVEAGTWRWRRDAGAWSAAADITDQNLPLSDGLYVRFERGAEPSFVAGDLFSFEVRQPNAPAHLATPTDEVFRWDGSGDTLTADLGGTQTIDALVIARHTLPDGAAVTVDGSADGGSTWTQSVALTRRGGVMAELLDTAWEVDTLRLIVTGASGAEIGWWWAGEALSTANNADNVRLNRRYALTAGGGIDPSALYAGAGRGGEISWENWAGQTDLDNLLAMIAHAKEQGDEPLVFVPHYLHPGEAALVRIAANQIEIEDWMRFQPDQQSDRMLSVTLPLEGVIE